MLLTKRFSPVRRYRGGRPDNRSDHSAAHDARRNNVKFRCSEVFWLSAVQGEHYERCTT